MTEPLPVLCDLCHEPLEVWHIWTLRVGKRVLELHSECYDVALKRMERFLKRILVPEEEFEAWLNK